MATVKPLQAWAMEEAQRRARAAQPTAAESLLPVAAALPPVRENNYKNPHDFDKSAGRAADFAQQKELQRTGFEQRKELQGLENDAQKDMLRFRMDLQRKYAPRRGGAGPVSKLAGEYIKIISGPPAADDRQATANQGRLKLIREKLQRLGRSGQGAIADFDRVGLTPDAYSPAANKLSYESKASDRKLDSELTKLEREGAAAELAALSRLIPKPDMLMDEKAKADRAAMEAEVRAKAAAIAKPFDRSKYKFEDGMWKERD